MQVLSVYISMTFDENKFYLGKLCKRFHEFEKSGKTLKTRNGRNCQKCLNERTYAYRAKDSARLKSQRKQWRASMANKSRSPVAEKECRDCQKTFPVTNFYPDKYSGDKLNPRCISCDKKYQAEIRAKKPKRVIICRPESELLESRKRSKSAYKKTPKGKIAMTAHRHRRRCQINNNGYEYYKAEQLFARFAEFNNECAYCGSVEKLTIDHIVSISKGGADLLSNIVPACVSCNPSKGNKDLIVWYKSKPFFSESKLQKILDSSSNSEAMAFSRASAKFGLGLYLYSEK